MAVVVSPPNADDAERLLAQVNYRPTISWSERVPKNENIGTLITNVFILIGILLCFAAVAGLAFGGLRVLRRHGREVDPDAMTVLRIRNR